jgi:hypothetical protein
MPQRSQRPHHCQQISGTSQEVIAAHYTHLTNDDAYDAIIRALSGGGGR